MALELPEIIQRFRTMVDTGGSTAGLAALGAGSVAAGKDVDNLGKAAEKSGGTLRSIFSSIAGAAGVTLPGFSKSIADVADKMSSTTGKSTGLMATLEKIGGVSTAAVIVGAAAGGAALGKMGSDMEDADVAIATASGDTIKHATAIGDAFLSTVGTSTYSGLAMAKAFAPVSPVLGEVAGHALTTAQSLTFMKSAGDLATATGGNLASVASDVAKSLQTFHQPLSDATSDENALFNASRLTGESVDALTSQLTRAKSQLGVLSPSLADTSTMLLDLSEHGENGRVAMSALSSSLTAVISPLTSTTAASKGIAAAQQAMGLQLKNAQGNFVGYGSLIAQIAPKLQGMTTFQGLATLKAIGFTSANTKMLDTIKAGGSVYDSDKAKVTASTAVHDAAQKQSQTLSAQWGVLKASISDVATQIGTKILPVFDELMKKLSSTISWMEKNKGAVEAVAIALGSVLGATMVLFVGQKVKNFIDGIGKTVESLVKWVTQSGATAAASTASTEVIDANATAQKLAMDKLAAQSTANSATIAEAFARIDTASATMEGATLQSFDEVGININAMATQIQEAGARADAALTGIGLGARETATGFAISMDGMEVATAEAATGMDLAIGSTGIGLILIGLGLAVTLLLTHWKQAWHDIKNWFEDAKNYIVIGLPLIFGPIGLVTSAIIELATHWKQAWSDIKNWSDDAWQFIDKKIFAPIHTFVTGPLVTGIHAAEGAWDTAWGAIKGAVNTAYDFMSKNVFTPIHDFLSGPLTDVINTLKGTWDTVWGDMQGTIEAVWKFIQPVLQQIENAINAVIGPLKTMLGLVSKVGGIFGDIGKWLTSGPGEPKVSTGGSGNGNLQYNSKGPGKKDETSIAETNAEKLRALAQQRDEKVAAIVASAQAKQTAAAATALAKRIADAAANQKAGAAAAKKDASAAASAAKTAQAKALAEAKAAAALNAKDMTALAKDRDNYAKVSTSTSLASLNTMLDKTHFNGMEELIKHLSTIHSLAADKLIVSTINEYQKALKVQAADQKAANADIAAKNDAATSTLNNQIADDGQTAADAVTAAADLLDQAAQKVAADVSSGAVGAVNDATSVSTAQSDQTVKAIQDQSVILQDQLAETGLTGTALIEAQDKLALDQQKQADDAKIAADNLAIAQQKQTDDINNAKALAHVDAVAATEALKVAAAKAALDTATQTDNDNVNRAILAKAIADNGTNTVLKSNADKALVDAQKAQALDTSSLTDAYNKAVDTQTQDNDTANDLLSASQQQGALLEAQLAQALATDTGNAAQIEAQLQAVLDGQTAADNAAGGTSPTSGTAAAPALTPLQMATLGLTGSNLATATAAFAAMFGVPSFGTGALVTGPTLAMVGESGPEMVIPMNQFPAAALAGGGYTSLPASSPGTSATKQGVSVTVAPGAIILNGADLTEEQIEDMIANALLKFTINLESQMTIAGVGG